MVRMISGDDALRVSIGGQSDKTREASWATFVGNGSDQIAFCVDEYYPSKSKISQSINRLVLATKAKALMATGAWPDGTLAETTRTNSEQRNYVAASANKRMEISISGYESGLPAPITIDCKPEKNKCLRSAYKVSAFIPILKMPRGPCTVLIDETIIVKVHSLDINGRLFFENRGRMYISIDEQPIKQDADSLMVQLDIGEVELSAMEAINLRPGIHIELDRPEKLLCTLRLGSAAFALAELNIREDRLILKVKEIYE